MYGARHENIIPCANKLRRESPLIGFVYNVLNKELSKINLAIDNAHRTGKDNVVVKLTFNFNCPDYIENKDVQTNVYYKIIEDLERETDEALASYGYTADEVWDAIDSSLNQEDGKTFFDDYGETSDLIPDAEEIVSWLVENGYLEKK